MYAQLSVPDASPIMMQGADTHQYRSQVDMLHAPQNVEVRRQRPGGPEVLVCAQLDEALRLVRPVVEVRDVQLEVRGARLRSDDLQHVHVQARHVLVIPKLDERDAAGEREEI